ncbi:N-acetyltransferase [Rhodobacteraceae bacterium RKSG542]|uniref:GNAT family N-acetyltransferase n=1 Tax=Pseudovibrio flavus TaxID=2529854 RepID=UPI0012BD620C|nr:GNAT family N-acetyltransferase [Pseudovibrio flavus]MTI17754.1 N-acetyltransferase [Pseudovibrio flavus]
MVVEYEEVPEESSYSADGLPQDTAHLVIDRVRTDDLADIMFLANNKRVAEMLTAMPHPFTLEDAKALVKRSAQNSMQSRLFAIRMKNTGRIIGCIGYGPMQEDDGVMHVGYWIGEPFWGNGFGTEAVHAVADFIFNTTVFHELSAACRVNNPASKRVLEKSGFQLRNQSMMHSRGAGGKVAVDRFSLKKTTWTALKRWGSAA